MAKKYLKLLTTWFQYEYNVKSVLGKFFIFAVL